jgi:uncharacterized protein YecE (DUF72 family)
MASPELSEFLLELHLGPAGWSYSDWDGVVYPARRGRGFRPLQYLARYFNAVEINTSFYRIPSPSLCEKWAEEVEPFDDFLFSAKLWQDFTHVREALDTRSLNQWHSAMEPLRRAGRLGAVLVQFPWSFKRTRPNAKYLDALTLALAPDPLAIEMRHDSWNSADFLAWLRERGHAFCNIDQPRLGHCLPPTEHVTAPLTYIRLHGRNTENWFREEADVAERYKYLYSKEEIGDWVERFRRLIEKAEKVFVITNNHTEGRAVVNALQIKAMLTDSKVEAPPGLVRRYPELADFAQTPPSDEPMPPAGEQLSLF